MNLVEDVKVLDNLRKKYGELSASEMRIADFILQNPEGAVNCNVSELANASGTSDATIIRFCKHAGYSGYYQLRLSLSRELGQIERIKGTNANLQSVPGILQTYSANIASIGEVLDEGAVRKSADLLEHCHCVHIIAAGNTTPLAQYMGFRFGRLGIRAAYHVLTEYYLNDIVLADKNDIVLAISKSGSSKQVLNALRVAKEKNLTTIAIVGYQQTPVSELADIQLSAARTTRICTRWR